MTAHLAIVDLVERSDAPEVQDHLAACASCRAQARLLGTLDAVPFDDLPGLDAARAAMSAVLSRAGGSMSRSMGSAMVVEADPLEVGRTFERYTVEALLGHGGMGSVYRVRHTALGSTHALKVLPRRSSSVRDRLVREGQAQSRMSHPAVVPVTDIVDVDGAPGLVMELVDGPSLAAWLREHGPPTLGEADRLAMQIIRGVAAAHDAGIIHRDIKPGNVLLAPTDEGFVAKVADFGLARLLEEPGADPTHSAPETPLGTPSYMAPEQIADASRADERSDVFALGAVLYELLTARRAFPGLAVGEIYERVQSGRYTPVQQLRPDAPPRMVQTIDRALAVDPADRFESCRALLESWRGPTAAATPPSTRPWAILGGLLAVVALLGVMAWSWQQPGAGVDAAATAADAAAVADASAHVVHAERRLTAEGHRVQVYGAALAPAGDQLAWTDGRGLWLHPLDQGEPRAVLLGGPLHNVDFLPDGQRVMISGWLDEQKGTWVVSLDSGQRELLQDRTGAYVRLSPDGTRVAVVDSTGLWVSDLDGGDRVQVRPLTGAEHAAGLTFSPSGRYLAAAFQSAADGTWLEVSAVDGSETRRLVQDGKLQAFGIAAMTWIQPDRLLYTLTELDSDDPEVQLMAIDSAETATDGDSATLLHTWTGHAVLRLLVSADGKRLATSHVETRQDVWMMPTDGSTPPARLTHEAWSELPVGWTPDGEVLVQSELGGGSIVARRADDGSGRIVGKERGALRRAAYVGDDLLYWRASKEDGPETALALQRLAPGQAPTPLMHVAVDKESRNYVHLMAYNLDCRSNRCVLSDPADGALRFSDFDPIAGERGEELFRVDVTSRLNAWALSPDGRTLALALSDPARVQLHDLDTGQHTERKGALDLPESMSWAADGQALYLGGLVHDAADCYQVFSMPLVGEPRRLWSSMSQNPFVLHASPDQQQLALGVHTYDDDLYLAETEL